MIPSASSSRWTSPTLTGAADLVSTDLKALSAHVARCRSCQGRWFTLQCAAEAVHAFIAPRFVTTLAVVAAVFGVCTLVL